MSKDELIKDLKPEEKQQIDLLKMIEENCKNVTEDDLKNLENDLNFEYQYKVATTIPTKTSITAIAHKNMDEIKFYSAEDILEDDENMENEISFPIPKFLINGEEEKITAGKRGTIVHLCMKNLDFSKNYELQDIKELITSLVDKEIITLKEANSINVYQILQFTKSDIWQELKQAKEYHKEEAFYINVPLKEIEDIDSEESVLAQGIIDLYYIDKDNKLVLLDYKTDFVREGEEEILIKRHTSQLILYKQALEGALNRNVDKIYIYSTVIGKTIEIKS